MTTQIDSMASGQDNDRLPAGENVLFTEGTIVLRRPEASASYFPWADLVTPPARRRLKNVCSYVLSFVAFLFFGVATTLAAYLLDALVGPLEYWQRLLVYGAVLGFLILPVTFWLWTVARRLRAPNALAVMKRDRRPPVLLLRQFDDDQISVDNAPAFGSWRRVMDYLGLQRRISFEEMLYDRLSTLGPVIAIGRPGERLPPLGASRFWVSDDKWQEVVEHLLLNSQLVVMIMGSPQEHVGLTWEVNKVMSEPYCEKSALVMPPIAEAEASHRWEQYRELAGNRLPVYQGDEVAVLLGGEQPGVIARGTASEAEVWRDEQSYRNALRTPPPSRWSVALAILVLVALACQPWVNVAIPGIQRQRELKAAQDCREDLRQIGTALHNGAESQPQFPGQQRFAPRESSWSAWVLPFVEQKNLWSGTGDQSATDQWKQLSEMKQPVRVPSMFCPSDSTPPASSHGTSLFAPWRLRVGDYARMQDGTSNTLLLSSVPGSRGTYRWAVGDLQQFDIWVVTESRSDGRGTKLVWRVVQLREGSPAAEAGLKVDDVLLEVDGKPPSKASPATDGTSAPIVGGELKEGAKPKVAFPLNWYADELKTRNRVDLILSREGKQIDLRDVPLSKDK